MKKFPIPLPVLVSGGAAIVIGGFMGYSRANSDFESIPSSRLVAKSQVSETLPTPQTQTPNSQESHSVPFSSPHPIGSPPGNQSSLAGLPSVVIRSCKGIPSSANFRSAPTLAQWAVLGEIQAGQRVYLTGQTVQADGEIWHEAIAPAVIPDPGKAVSPNQIGWIASCFVQN